ncbi:three-Cys-motif partner protein TcmP [Magnetovibrio sp. PR-2]|uniref:three-Cys-motif partner protein TcmP n=1 Tax=Magnetovibrio sp. PR-2 TaxID=3120356 RepID=UPI002FCE5057
MAAPKTPIWDLDPHTRAKHEILGMYLYSWVPILSQGGFPVFLYIDGFSGPGRYSKGEDGSPIIAIKAALAHLRRIKSTILYYFVEYDKERSNNLQSIIKEMLLPENFRIKIVNDEFEVAFDELMDFYRDKSKPLHPTFAFIDPFGWKGVPFSIVREILSHRSCEVFVNFMYEEINRFLSHPDQIENFDRFFGTSDWKNCSDLKKPIERNRCLHDLYYRQLRASAKAKYVRSFEMKNAANNTDYFLFYATNSKKGIMKMKEAMWRTDSSGEFTFSDATDPNQMIMFANEPNFAELSRQIQKVFNGQTVTVEEIEEYILTETAFRESHYKRQVLRPLELSNPPKIQVLSAPEKRRPGTYSDPNLKIQFL